MWNWCCSRWGRRNKWNLWATPQGRVLLMSFFFYVETAKVVRNKPSTTSQDDTAAVETVPSTWGTWRQDDVHTQWFVSCPLPVLTSFQAHTFAWGSWQDVHSQWFVSSLAYSYQFLSSNITWGSWQEVYGWFAPLLASLLTSFCACTLHDAPYCWFSMNQRICREGWLVFEVLELLCFKPILSKGFLKLLAALQSCWWWKWSSDTLWATLIRLWLHSLSCYCWTMKLSLWNPLGFKDSSVQIL
jgi:hypothetical protein